MLAFLSGIGPTEMLVVGVVAVLLFGARLPSVARSMGKSLTEFRRGMQDLQDEFRDAMHESDAAASRTPALEAARQPTVPRIAGDDPSAAHADGDVEGADVEGVAEGDAAEDDKPADPAADPALAAGYPEPTKPPYAD